MFRTLSTFRGGQKPFLVPGSGSVPHLPGLLSWQCSGVGGVWVSGKGCTTRSVFAPHVPISDSLAACPGFTAGPNPQNKQSRASVLIQETIA